MVFDAPGIDEVFSKRYEIFSNFIENKKNKYLAYAKQEVCRDEAHLNERLG